MICLPSIPDDDPDLVCILKDAASKIKPSLYGCSHLRRITEGSKYLAMKSLEIDTINHPYDPVSERV